jgi:hypothetical protein
VQHEQESWEFASLPPEDKARIRTLDDAYMAAVRWVEDLPCNQTGADKSWVARVEESDRRYFSRVRPAPEPEDARRSSSSSGPSDPAG